MNTPRITLPPKPLQPVIRRQPVLDASGKPQPRSWYAWRKAEQLIS